MGSLRDVTPAAAEREFVGNMAEGDVEGFRKRESSR